MLNVKKYLLSILPIFTTSVYSSQEQALLYSHGQKNLYSQNDLTETVRHNFQKITSSFNARPYPDYRTAATLAVGVQHYINVMNLPPIDSTTEKTLNYIIAYSHMKLQSPQHALSAFKKIYDQETIYGTFTSADIADCLRNKIEMLSPENILTQKLSLHATFFEQESTKKRLKSYKKEYKKYNLDELINKLRITRDNEIMSILILCIKKYALQNNMRALCIMATAYNIGKYGLYICQDTALKYAYRYLSLLAQNPATIPLEHFGIKLTFINGANNSNQSAYIALLYYKHLEAMRNMNTLLMQTTINDLHLLKDAAAPLRTLITNISTHQMVQRKTTYIKDIQKLQKTSTFEQTIKALIASEKKILIPLLQSLLTIQTTSKKVINYTLGLLYFYKKNPNYTEAKNYLKKSDPNKENFLTNYLRFICDKKINPTNITYLINILIPLIQKSNLIPKATFNDYFVKYFLLPHLSSNSSYYIYQLFDKNRRLMLTFCANLLLNDIIAPLIIELIKNVKTNLNLSKNQDNRQLFNTLYSSDIQQALLTCCTKNYSPETLLHLAECLEIFLQSSLINQQNRAIIIKNIKICLEKLNKFVLFSQSCKPEIASLYNTLAKRCPSMGLFNKAIAYGSIDAHYGKACLLLQSAPSPTKTQEALKLLKTHANTASPLRYKSLNKLGEICFKSLTEKTCFVDKVKNNEEAFLYLTKAAHMNKLKHPNLLAMLYTQKPQNNMPSLIKEDYSKALHYFQMSKHVNQKYKTDILFLRGITYYKNSLFKEALKDFESISLCSLSKTQQASLLLYRIATQLKLKNKETNILHNLFFQLLTQEESFYLYNDFQPEDVDFSLIDSTIEPLFIKTTTDIMTHNKDFPHQIELCSTIGKIFCKDIDTKIEIETEKNRFKHGLKCLQYAANKGDYIAQFTAGCLSEKNVSVYEIIHYLLQAYTTTNKPQLAKAHENIKQILTARLPRGAVDQYQIFNKMDQEKNNYTPCYLHSLSFIEEPTYINFQLSKELQKKILCSCKKNNRLKILAGEFIAHPQESSILEQQATSLLACLLLYSKEKSDIYTSIQYLTQLHTLPCCKLNYLGIAYYKLAMLAKKKKEDLFYCECLKKSALYQFYPALDIILVERVKKNPLFTKIPEKNVLEWMLNRSTHPLENVSQDSNIIVTPAIHLINVLKDHFPLAKALFIQQNSTFSKNKQYLKALEIYYKDRSIDAFFSLIQKLSHPHAYFILAVENQNDEKLFTEYITKAFNYGVTKKQNENYSAFVDYKLLEFVHDFFVIATAGTATISTSEKHLLQIIIKKLTERTFNIATFKQLLFNTNNINLDDFA